MLLPITTQLCGALPPSTSLLITWQLDICGETGKPRRCFWSYQVIMPVCCTLSRDESDIELRTSIRTEMVIHAETSLGPKRLNLWTSARKNSFHASGITSIDPLGPCLLPGSMGTILRLFHMILAGSDSVRLVNPCLGLSSVTTCTF